MSDGHKHEPKGRDRLSRLTSTVTRCHLLGSITAVSLIIGITWVWSLGRKEVPTIQIGETTVDLSEAAALVENADEWRRLYTVNFRNSEAVDERARDVASWLPTTVVWPETEHQLRSAMESNQLTVLSITRGKTHVGTRVGVVVANCEVRGTYASLCRFLSELSTRPQPIACSEFQLHRIGDQDDVNTDPRAQNCRATLWLRIPFAASGTPAGRISEQVRPINQNGQTLVRDQHPTRRLITPGTNNAT